MVQSQMSPLVNHQFVACDIDTDRSGEHQQVSDPYRSFPQIRSLLANLCV